MVTYQNPSCLAINGGPRIRSVAFPERGHVGSDERDAVVALFNHAESTGVAPGYGGEEESAYCREFAEWLGGGYADAVSSGTAGIYVALKSLEIDPFQEVIVSAVTDPGGLMPVPLLNLIPMIADTEPGSYNSGAEEIAPLISPRTRAIVVPHIAGEPADIEGIVDLARRHSIPVIEDCSQSHGACVHGGLVGSFGHMSVFSTMHGKHHSSGGQGGLIFTANEERYQRICRASDRGKPLFLPSGSSNCIASLNLNSSEISAAIGRVQFRKLPQIVARRREIVEQLTATTSSLGTVAVPVQRDGAAPSYWFLRMNFHEDVATCGKNEFCQALEAEGLPVASDYRAAMPHKQQWFLDRRVFGSSGYPWSSPAYEGDPTREFPCPNAEAAMEKCFSLYFHENWTDEDVADAAAILAKVDAVFSTSGRAASMPGVRK